MPKLDKHHEAVKNALIKDGWTITDDPLTVEFEDVYLYADIGAERTLAAEKGAERIAVEIKVFGSVSNFSELQKAAGQYQMYVIFLQELEPERKVFLAISQEIYNEFFQRPSVKFFVRKIGIKILVFDSEKEEIVQWIN
jgi:XisH protein